MVQSKLIEMVLSPKTVETDYKGPLCASKVRIQLPDMTSCDRTVLGDWGPMYHVKLNHDFPILIEWTEGGETRSTKIQLQSLAVESPPEAAERQQNPLYMKIPWEEKQLTVNLYFSASGQVEFLQFRPYNPSGFWGKIAANA